MRATNFRELNDREIAFVGGGHHQEKCRVIVIDGKVVLVLGCEPIEHENPEIF